MRKAGKIKLSVSPAVHGFRASDPLMLPCAKKEGACRSGASAQRQPIDLCVQPSFGPSSRQSFISGAVHYHGFQLFHNEPSGSN